MPDSTATEIVIAPATVQDADEISRLILSLQHSFLLDEKGAGAEQFLQSIGPSAIAALISAPNMVYIKALHGTRLAGLLAVRDGTHVYHLFVDPMLQREGVSRRLWMHLLAMDQRPVHERAFTVNSSVPAVPVYQHFGFKATGPQLAMKGIAFVPMRRVPEWVTGS